MSKANDNQVSKQKLTPVSQLGEFGLINKIAKTARIRQASTLKGIGDDAAVITNQEEVTVVSTDLLVEGIHFDLMYTPLKHLGYKAVVVNLSDIYAMNANPTQITVSIAISSRFTVEAIEELYDGIFTACSHYNVDLIGGDTSSTLSGMVISITALGTAKKDKVIYRDTAQEGDYICVTGDLGAAYLGLQLLEREKQIFLETPDAKTDLENQDYLVGRLLKPEARKDMLDILESYSITPTSMLDISDGLSSDLIHICKASKVGCQVFEENIPLHQDTVNMAKKFKISPITCALSGGEDYELLFTIKEADKEKIADLVGITILGKITNVAEGYTLYTKGGKAYDLIAQGWKHV